MSQAKFPQSAPRGRDLLSGSSEGRPALSLLSEVARAELPVKGARGFNIIVWLCICIIVRRHDDALARLDDT